MELKTYDNILTEMCDNFDALISPKRLARVNSNVIYLMFKAISKGYEIINNVCVDLSNKFDPMNCSDEDLDSVASLVGTERNKGSASGLHIFIENTGETEVTLLQGTYIYKLDDETHFEFEVLRDESLAVGAQLDYIAMSNKIGKFEVTAQTEITVESSKAVPEGLVFSCSDNLYLLGLDAESSIDFRKRINSNTDRQNTVFALEEYIRNLPYAFDCKIKFNNTNSDITVDGITIPPFNALIFYSGEIKNELAEKIADRIMFPTVATENSVEVTYENDVFASGEYKVNIVPFIKDAYNIVVTYKADEQFVNVYDAKEEITKALKIGLVAEKHKDYVKEDDVYNIIENLNIAGFEVLGIDLVHNGNNVSYIAVPTSKIAELKNVNFLQG